MNSYPFLNNKHKPIFTSDLADIVPRARKERVIDITSSPVVPASSLRTKLELLHKAGELDGGLPIIRDDILVGLIPAPDLEYALDNLPDEGSGMCLMAHVPSIDDSDDGGPDPCDFTPYIDPVCSVSMWLGRNADKNKRHLWRWISGRPWTWCTSALSSWGCGTYASFGMDGMPGW